MEADDAPERVKLQIVFPGTTAAKGAVRVVGKSRDHEKCVFEKEGFVFKRARRTPPPPPPPAEAPAVPDAAAAAAPAAVQAGSLDQLMPDAAAPADQQLPPQGADQQQQQQPWHQQRQQQDLQPGAPLGPLRFTMAASELAYLVQWVLATELRLGGGGSGADGAAAAAGAEAAAQAAGDRVTAALLQRSQGAAAATAGKEGQSEAGAEPATVALAPAVVLPFQVARLKSRLSEKRDWLLRVEKAWDEVEAQYGTLNTPEAQPPAATDAAVAPHGGDAPAPVAAEGEAAVAAAEGEEDEGREGEAAAAPGEGSATAARAAAVARMELQADEMEALVAKVELAAAEAEAVATALQARFHSARFSLYPHVNSPALLIKSLIRAPRAAAAAGGSAPTDA